MFTTTAITRRALYGHGPINSNTWGRCFSLRWVDLEWTSSGSRALLLTDMDGRRYYVCNSVCLQCLHDNAIQTLF